MATDVAASLLKHNEKTIPNNTAKWKVVDRREGKERLIPGVSGLDRRSLETHTTSEKTHTMHRAEELIPTHPCAYTGLRHLMAV